MTTALDALVTEVQACRRCSTMEGRRRVFGAANGRLDARVLFVAEAPGRLGGDRTGIPLSADQTGRNFELLLAEAGLARDEVFVTNAVLCNPRTASGNNRAPSRRELVFCAGFLARTVDLLAAPVVVALGAIALTALGSLEAHGLTLRAHVGQPTRWRGRTLVALYHPGARARIHRPLAAQQADFRALAATIAACL